MLFMSYKLWIVATGVILLAIFINLIAYNGSFCKENSEESFLCKSYYVIAFYRLAWRTEAIESIVRIIQFFMEKRPHLVVTPWKENLFSHDLLWMAPFLSGGGYCSEALSFILGLATCGTVPYLSIQPHGDMANEVFWEGLPLSTKRFLIEKVYKQGLVLNNTVVICHSEPGAWYPPLYETFPCPPSGYGDAMYVIGRTMFETDRLSSEHVKRCNKMDEIWVPSAFNVETFAKSGVDPSKLVRIGQSVDVLFFNPKKVRKALVLPSIGHVFGPKMSSSKNAYVFLSIFKWESRKGWDLLIQAYMEEFSAKDNVLLFIQTNAYHSEKTYDDEIRGYVKKMGLAEPLHGWPSIYVSDEHVPQLALPSLYKAANAFVLPSRGEGWGRPHVEAMAMSLPIIATNWSGMTEYMNEENSYPLHVENLVEIEEGPFKGHFWAHPSVKHLRYLMRHVYTHPLEAKAKGLLARKTMVDRFSPEVLTREIVQHLMRIARKKSIAKESR